MQGRRTSRVAQGGFCLGLVLVGTAGLRTSFEAPHTGRALAEVALVGPVLLEIVGPPPPHPPPAAALNDPPVRGYPRTPDGKIRGIK
jgi:hypothetical protein